MKKEKYHSFTDKCLNTISRYSPFLIMIFSAIFVSLLSFTFVYFFSQICTASLEAQLFRSSIIIPLITTPIIVAIMIRFSKHLKHYKEDIKVEIEKNKKKDLIMFEQARFVLMGEMMANISHQWKQPLNNVALAIVSTRLNDSVELRERNFDIMEENINYLSNTIDDFMSFFERRSANEVRPISEIIDEVKSIMKAQIESSGIKLSINIDETLNKIKVSSILSQVLLNLLSNAKDAMDNSNLDNEIVMYFKDTSDSLEISCCDNGKGIDKKIVLKIFDPYFTTKVKKQGTGIGLYMSKQIISEIFDGTIVLEEMRKKTCFKINIPYSKSCQLKK